MKKGLLGCVGVLLVLMLVAGGTLYYFVYKPFVSDYVGGAVQLAELSELNERLDHRTAYAPPADGELSEEQVERFLRVQEQMKERLGQRFDALKAKYERLEAEWQQEGRRAGYREVLGAWRDMAGLLTEAKRAQVDALNQQDFSLEEYEWVRREVYRAAGVEIPAVLFGDMAEAARNGQFSLERPAQPNGQDVPARNRELVRAHAEALEQNAGFAWFGL